MPDETFDDASQSVDDRLDAAFGAETSDGLGPAGAGDPEGSPPAPSVEPGTSAAGPDPFSDEAVDALVPENMPYRDAKILREQVTKLRDQYRPLNDAFGDEGVRRAVLDAAPHLGADIARVNQTFAGMHPSDRQWFLDVFELMATDPVRGAQLLAHGASVIQANQQGLEPPTYQEESAAGEANDEPAELDDDDYPTFAQLEQRLADHEAERLFMQDQERQRVSVLGELKELGYDFDKANEDPIEQARLAAVLDLAQSRYDGDLKKADAVVNAWLQRNIDEYVQGKAANAGRPTAPSNVGTAPHQERSLDTMDDAMEAMHARLDGVLGPDPRGR